MSKSKSDKSKTKPKAKPTPKAKATPKPKAKPKAVKDPESKAKAKPTAAPDPESKATAEAPAPEGAKAKGKGKRGRPPNPPRALPNDPEPTDDTNGKGPKIPATVILCQLCGEPNHVPTSTTATSIKCKCGRCENLITVTGAKLAKLRVYRDAIRIADQLSLLPTAQEPPDGKGKGESRQRVPEYTVVRIKCTHTQHTVISIAMEVARRMSNDDKKDWSGRSLELICADFLSGAPGNVVQAVTEERHKAAEAADAVERQHAS